MPDIKHSTDYLNYLVHAYRDGESGAAETLIKVFQPILGKYARLCRFGMWSRNDRDTTAFLAMLGKHGLDETAEMLKNALTAYDREDIEQELILALLTTARKYLNISANFKFVFKRQLQKLIRDPLVYSGGTRPKLMPDMDTYRSVQDEELELDIAWINGRTTRLAEFQHLTPLQRAILKLIYHDGRTESEVMQELSIGSKSTLRRQIKDAKRILRFFRSSFKAAEAEKEATSKNNGLGKDSKGSNE